MLKGSDYGKYGWHARDTSACTQLEAEGASSSSGRPNFQSLCSFSAIWGPLADALREAYKSGNADYKMSLLNVAKWGNYKHKRVE